MQTLLCFIVPSLLVVLPLPAQELATDSRDAPAILTATVPPTAVPPGKPVRVTYRWNAVPTGKDYKVFVHAVDAKGAMRFQDDHEVPFPARTSTWKGAINYTHAVNLPAGLPDGTYRLEAGLWDPKAGRATLLPGDGVRANPDQSYVVGTLTVDAKAPAPPLDSARAQTLDLTGYHLTFQDEFNGPLDVSATGPGTKWIAHTPSFADFGDAAFANPDPATTPFGVKDGILTIEARQQANGKWTSGLLSSVDPKGHGFSQRYGYFEMRAKLPGGDGTWPAFWLLSQPNLTDKSRDGVEVDIVEQYGMATNLLHTTFHWWFTREPHGAVADQFNVADMAQDFHRYGFLYDEQTMVWYFDGVELWRQPTPPEAKVPMYVLINLALGGGWPIDRTLNPSRMLIDYVRVYAK